MTIADARRALEVLAAQHCPDPEALALLMKRADEYAEDVIDDVWCNLHGRASLDRRDAARERIRRLADG